MIEDYAVNQERVRYLANPIDTKTTKIMAQARFNDDRDLILETRYVVNVASFTDQKNHELLIEVYSQVIESQADLKLVLLGDGEKKCRIKDICTEKGIVINDLIVDDFNSDAQVYFLGFQTNPYPFVQHSQLFILTSYWEGLPIAVLEAMCLGKTLVLTDCSSAVREIMLGSDEEIDWVRRDEAIRTDYGYMLQNPGETKDLLNYDLWERAINTILVDDRFRRECGKAAKAYAQYHDVSILEERWENLFAR
jgi:glycosyltransferase involved in cell wall biosynthesis